MTSNNYKILNILTSLDTNIRRQWLMHPVNMLLECKHEALVAIELC